MFSLFSFPSDFASYFSLEMTSLECLEPSESPQPSAIYYPHFNFPPFISRRSGSSSFSSSSDSSADSNATDPLLPDRRRAISSFDKTDQVFQQLPSVASNSFLLDERRPANTTFHRKRIIPRCITQRQRYARSMTGSSGSSVRDSVYPQLAIHNCPERRCCTKSSCYSC